MPRAVCNRLSNRPWVVRFDSGTGVIEERFNLLDRLIY